MINREVINPEDIVNVITDFTEKNHERAIILLLLGGMKQDIFRNLKIIDLLNACREYIDDPIDNQLNSLLNMDPIESEMIALWHVDEGQLLCSTPQSLFFIFKHLQERIDKGKLQYSDVNDYLLVNTSFTQLDKNYTSDWLDPSFRNKFNETNNVDVEFTAGNLIHTFDEICNEYLPRDQFKESTIKIFKGRKLSRKEDRNYYKSILEDNNILINQFKHILTYLTVDLNYDKFSSDKVENSFSEECTSVTTKEYSNDEIRQILKDYYMNNLNNDVNMDYDKYDFIMNIVYHTAIYHNNEWDLFKEDEDYLKELFLNAKIIWLFYDHPNKVEIKFCPDSDRDYIFNQVCEVIEDVGVLSLIPFDFDLFEEYFFSHPSVYIAHYYDECARITLSEIGVIVSSFI